MLELFERSEWIADKVIRFPALLDELIDPLLGRHLPGPEDLARSVARVLDAAPGTEAVLEALNYLKLATVLRIAVGQLHGGLDGETARAALSGLADAVLAGVLEIARSELVERHGRFPGEPRDGALGIIGYGSLGARELGYESDLDIVFLFDAPPDGAQSDGARPLPPERYFARLAQRVLSFLTVMTPSGRLYEVDTRLRPNGRAGSLVSSIGAFREYQSNEAWTWELQALTRARFVAGAPPVAARFNRGRQEVLCRQRDEAALAAELRDMRQRMNREHAADEHLDLGTSPKHRPGGLIDIEFLAQLGVLSNARLYPRVIQATGTLAQLAELEAIGWLCPEDAAELADTMRRLRSKRMMQSLLRGNGSDSGAEDSPATARITADRLGLKQGETES
jgi:glutamate-ammonia-ligase adenylyltransferase